ncbi:hypothetical protein TrLO_g1425 [Triparma laevis f. longispina]|uniref:Carbamoyl-phosphate synthase small subunit N-terminal domain-containing protein n=1 Tax=Triparma laevis f. longispina TaxID=1714387 RepID=A0A9W7KY23_9STRA|nr:hypothetical protein TrLO_g1425 [Triparma laevis f. longispina]
MFSSGLLWQIYAVSIDSRMPETMSLLPPIPIPIFPKKMVSKRSSSSGTPGANKSVKRSVSPIPGSMEVDDSSGSDCLQFKGSPGTLHLSDNTSYKGFSFGADKNMAGEVVFNTGMVGYPEALTDPSYRGQILVLTFPLIGNYGVPDENDVDAHGLPTYFESNEIHIAGLIVSSYSFEHSHWTATRSLSDWLKKSLPSTASTPAA